MPDSLGTPGAGKSTVSRLVAARLSRSARIDGDDGNQMITTGGVGPVSEPAVEAERQLKLRARNICSLANNFDEFGFYPVIDHVVPNRRVLDFMLGVLIPRPILFVTLAPALEIAVRRNGGRSPQEQVFYDFTDLRAEMSEQLGAVGWRFDTSDLTADQSATAIIREADRRAVV